MPLILSLDTALEEASVCLSDDKGIIGIKRNSQQMEHAAWIHTAISQMIGEAGIKVSDISAVAVTAGPGSYTGLRVGMATAKGLCYGLGIPLITESTLKLLAQRVKKEILANSVYASTVLICPMIDARRMEVFSAIYDNDLNEARPAKAIILTESSFSAELAENVILFCGNGSKKWQNLCSNPKAGFVNISLNVEDLAETAAKKFTERAFSNLAYTEPAYIKNVYTGKPNRIN